MTSEEVFKMARECGALVLDESVGFTRDELIVFVAKLRSGVRECQGIPRLGCNTKSKCGEVCSSCGRVHRPYMLIRPGAPRYELTDTEGGTCD